MELNESALVKVHVVGSLEEAQKSYQMRHWRSKLIYYQSSINYV
jgi:hypothetical protein